MKKYRVGIIGCGNIFSRHAVSVKQLDNTQLVAVCDVDLERAKAKADEYGVDYYTDYKEMLETANLDVVHVCTPHYVHAPIIIYACNKGKHVLTEKPMAIKLADAEEMVRVAEEKNVTLGVIFQNRYNPGSILIKETLESGVLGKIYSAKLSVTWNRSSEYYTQSDWKGTWEKEGGGVIINQAIHTLDLVRWFVDDEIESVEANITNRGHAMIEVEDCAEGLIMHKNGVTVGFYATNCYSYNAPVEIEIHCENGLVKMVEDHATISLNNGKKFMAGPVSNEAYGSVKRYWGVNHAKQIENYYDSLQKGVEPDITGKEALKTQRIICAIYDSGKSGVKVTL